jgi:enamine deaminase RidA (YjgF/YER057c/UK114 family)
MKREHINPPGLAAPRGYTHVVTAEGGKMVYVSGQVSVDIKGDVVGKGDIAAQAKQAYQNLKTALAAVGATPGDVVKMTTYVVNFKPEDLQAVREGRSQIFAPEKPPASTLVGVASLAQKDFLIEVEAVAMV